SVVVLISNFIFYFYKIKKIFYFFFFFQAEDGIRDIGVTGVQTCALPILPWDETRSFAVGEHARARGVDAPARLVSSAKSWLSHPAVDRRGPTLPVGAPEDIEKIS